MSAATQFGASVVALKNIRTTTRESRVAAFWAANVIAIIARAGGSILTDRWALPIMLATAIVYLVLRSSGSVAEVIAYGGVGVALLGDDLLLCGVLAMSITQILTRAENRRALRLAARLQVFRDALWRLVGTLTAVMTALMTADRTERFVFEHAFGAPFEGLSMSAGILAGALILIASSFAVWSLPRIAARRISSGQSLPAAAADGFWFGAIVGAVAIIADVRALAASGAWTETMGRMSWIALAASLAFATVRLLLPSAIDDEAQPLWIVFLGKGKPGRAARHHAATLAARWPHGAVTIVAPPEAALTWGGPHLRLAAIHGRLEAMFPQRPVHLADWADTLPPREQWETLPVREIYLEPALWPDLFESRLPSTAAIVAMNDGEPRPQIVDRLRALLPTGRTDFHVPASVKPEVIDARWPGVEIYQNVGEGDALISEWIRRNGKPKEQEIGLLVVIEHTRADRDFARRLASALRKQRDGLGRKVIPMTAATDAGWVERELQQAWANRWRLALLGRRMRKHGRLGSMFANVLTFVTRGAGCDLVVLENDAPVQPRPGAAAGVSNSLLAQADSVIAILLTDARRAVSAGVYTGLIDCRRDDSSEGAIGRIVSRYLARDFDAIELAVTDVHPVYRPALRVLFAREDHGIVRELLRRLRDRADVLSDDSMEPGDEWRAQIIAILEKADAVVIVVGKGTFENSFTSREVDLALEMQKLIIPVFIEPDGPMEHPQLAKFMVANVGEQGLLNLAQEDPGRERALDITAENIWRVVEVPT